MNSNYSHLITEKTKDKLRSLRADSYLSNIEKRSNDYLFLKHTKTLSDIKPSKMKSPNKYDIYSVNTAINLKYNTICNEKDVLNTQQKSRTNFNNSSQKSLVTVSSARDKLKEYKSLEIRI